MSPLEGAALIAGLTASGWPLAALACHLDPGPLARKERSPVRPDRLATLAIDERSPDWCHRHGCPMGQCPEPD